MEREKSDETVNVPAIISLLESHRAQSKVIYPPDPLKAII